jgi:uncharacterized protein (TIGR02284 family)
MSIMERNDKILEVLNDLIRINNDRIDGYQKAEDEARKIDVDIQALFSRFAEESKQYTSELKQLILGYGGNPAEDTTTSGKIYRVWMDLKAFITGKDRKAILASCEFGEDAAQKAYNEALSSEYLTPEVRNIIAKQQTLLRQSHDLVKKYRDLHAETK